MSEQNVAPAESPSVVPIQNIPPIVYHGEPVIPTDLLAKAYGASSQNVRNNFNKNKHRFMEKKHYFTVSPRVLRGITRDISLRDAPPPRGSGQDDWIMPVLAGKSINLYTKRGAALHAKMLETDTAWELYEVMVDHYFDSMEGEAGPQPKALPIASKEERRPLVEAVRTWVKLANGDYAQAHKQVNVIAGVSSVEQMNRDQVDIALAWVRQRIEAVVSATEAKALASADEIMVAIERLEMIIKKVREVTKGLPVAMEVQLMRHFLNKAGYLVD